MPNKIGRLSLTRDALLVAHEHLMSDGDEARALAVRALAEDVIQDEREEVEHALAAPADALKRWTQLAAAAELDGVVSPLAVKAARLFIEAAEAEARCTA